MMVSINFHSWWRCDRVRGELDEYKVKLLELQTQVPDMSMLDTLDIYLGGLEPTVRIHILGFNHVVSLERAL